MHRNAEHAGNMSELKINLGCGSNVLAGWHNHDWDVDITKHLPWENDSADMIFIEHCLEHVTGPEGFRFMKEAHRVLKPTGVLRICVPQLAKVANAKKADLIVNHGHLMVYCHENLTLMLEAAGFFPENIIGTGRKEIDGHWKVIGEPLDTAETLRVEATK